MARVGGGLRAGLVSEKGEGDAASATAATSDSGRFVLKGSKPAWASLVSQTAAASDAAAVRAKVWLAPRNAADLGALARAVSDPSSSQYGQFISASDYQSRFAPSADQVAQVQ